MRASKEEYLEALYTLTQNGQKAGTTAISQRLKLAPASVTEMLRKLADEGFVSYSPYQGVTLTRQGFEIAEKMTRKHRLLERFLHDILKIGNDKVHKEACEMEHALSDEAERALCRTLNAPDRCPDDGMSIPPCNLGFESCKECRQRESDGLEKIGKRQQDITAVSKLKERQEGTVAFIRGDNKVLRRLLDMGLTPGTRIKVNRIAPFKGPVEICVRGSNLALGEEVAGNVFVEKAAAIKKG
jgi:DtxR family transcriptional regulator, Mn-dependent transcriptional regulator